MVACLSVVERSGLSVEFSGWFVPGHPSSTQLDTVVITGESFI